jgi:DNA-binding NtrC family response regulator
MNSSSAHLLIVDDERSMRELLDYMLSKEGYTISLAENGRAAVEISVWGTSPGWKCCGRPRRRLLKP